MQATKARIDSRGEATSGAEITSRDEKTGSKKRGRQQHDIDVTNKKYFLPQSIIDAIARSCTIAPHFAAWRPFKSVLLTGRVSFRSFPQILNILIEKRQFDIIETALNSVVDLPEKALIQLLKALVNLDPIFLGQKWSLGRHKSKQKLSKFKSKKQKRVENGHCNGNGNGHGVDALVPKAFQSIEVMEPPVTAMELKKKQLLLKESIEPTNGHKNGHVNGMNGDHKEVHPSGHKIL